ncbi:hypothetical protein Tco_0115612 [Tanacetum coccineum]
MTTFRSSVEKMAWTVFLILLLQNNIVVRPAEDRADDGVTSEGSSKNVGLFANREQTHYSNSLNVISMVLGTKSTGKTS